MIINIYIDKAIAFAVPYAIGKEKELVGESFSTVCLDFFSFDTKAEDVIVWKEDGTSVKRSNLIRSNEHTDKEIRESHDIRKMLVAGKFKFT